MELKNQIGHLLQKREENIFQRKQEKLEGIFI